ncbi:hypothetical protein [Pseudomonas baetica]|uniref:hypothetical protein n=1 Tax=Pseudomonas baetica TaxID=674054 RepID=UPI002404C11A|nr:hypothetical protein [Pseudomonas baetica]MDF9778956.1 hypothetical protein [Pseudomonas baetica]
MTDKPQANPVLTTKQKDWLDAINAGHGVATTPSNFDPAVFERLQRIYAEGEPVKITGNVKVIRP